jgi:hypothetical protein
MAGLQPGGPGHGDVADHNLAAAAALANAATDVEGNQAAFFMLKANLSRQCASLYKAAVQQVLALLPIDIKCQECHMLSCTQMEALAAADSRIANLSLTLANNESILSKAEKKVGDSKAHVQKLKAAFQETQDNLVRSQAVCSACHILYAGMYQTMPEMHQFASRLATRNNLRCRRSCLQSWTSSWKLSCRTCVPAKDTWPQLPKMLLQHSSSTNR